MHVMGTIKPAKKMVTELRTAIAEDIEGIVNDEGRSRLDFLITRLHSTSSTERQHWLHVITSQITSGKDYPVGWWRSLERLVVLGNLESKELGELIEVALTEEKYSDALDRASMYDLLDECGKPPLASTIAADEELKQKAPVRWLDLMLARVPNQRDAQQLVLDAVQLGHFALPEFVQRLDEMRSIGGAQLRDWLDRFRGELNSSDRRNFDPIVANAFGIELPETHSTANPFIYPSPEERVTFLEIELQHAMQRVHVARNRAYSALSLHKTGPVIDSKALRNSIALIQKRKDSAFTE